MSTKSALRADLDAENRKTLAEDRKRMERLGKGSQRPTAKSRKPSSDLLISDGCEWSGVIAKLFAKSMRPTRKAG
jgi:hypothetical protein